MAHCWKDRLEYIQETNGDLSPEYCDYVNAGGHGETCMLPDGHSGPHEWTPDNEIVITFREAGNG